MRDLHEVIYLRVVSDGCIVQYASVYAAVCSYVYVVAYDYVSHVADFLVTVVFAQHVAVTIRAYHGS